MRLSRIPRFAGRFPLGRLLCLTIVCVAASCGACGGGNTPAPAPPQGDVPVFQADRAFADLQRQVDFGPRFPGSPGHQAQLDWMKATLAPLADRVVEQTFHAVTPFGGPFAFSNLIAVFPGRNPRPVTMLGAHWDTRPEADEDPDPARRSQPVPGANDGASGVAILLELARLFRDSPPPHTVYLVFLDAEDSGRVGSGMLDMGFCLGSNYLAQHWPEGLARPDRVVILDLVGGQSKHNPRVPVRTDLGGNDIFDLRIEGGSLVHAPQLVNEIWSVAERRGHSAFKRTVQGALIDDHVPFQRLGIPAAVIVDFPPPVWHTTDDTPEYCSPAALRQVGDTIAAWLYAP